MVLVAGAPLVTADTHHIVKGAQGPRASAVPWVITPTETGVWYGHIENSGLRSLVIDVNDNTTGAEISILHQRIRFAATGNILNTANVTMASGHVYNVIATPNGPRGTSCTVDDVFTVMKEPVAMFTYAISLDGATVTVDGSSSYDPNVGQTIKAWGWEWGDGSPVSTGVTASHTYTASKIYTITLTVQSTTGMTGSSSQDVPISITNQPPVLDPIGDKTVTVMTLLTFTATATDADIPVQTLTFSLSGTIPAGASITSAGVFTWTPSAVQVGDYTFDVVVSDGSLTDSETIAVQVKGGNPPPVASFIVTSAANAATVTVDASASTGTGALSYSWNWGDFVTGPSGVTSSHKYLTTLDWTITLTVTDSLGQKGTVSKIVHVVNTAIPPLPWYVVGTIYASDGVTPLSGCTVTITDVRTGTTLIVDIPSDETGFYAGDISPLYQLVGDDLIVNVVGPAGQTGSGTGVVGTDPYVAIDVTMSP